MMEHTNPERQAQANPTRRIALSYYPAYERTYQHTTHISICAKTNRVPPH